jgi:hypothetical protein
MREKDWCAASFAHQMQAMAPGAQRSRQDLPPEARQLASDRFTTVVARQGSASHDAKVWKGKVRQEAA